MAAKNQCKRCWRTVPWSEQRRSFGILTKRGVVLEDIKKVQPLCIWCTSVLLKERKATKGNFTGITPL